MQKIDVDHVVKCRITMISHQNMQELHEGKRMVIEMRTKLSSEHDYRFYCYPAQSTRVIKFNCLAKVAAKLNSGCENMLLKWKYSSFSNLYLSGAKCLLKTYSSVHD